MATTPRCRGERYSFPRIDQLYPWYVPYNVECLARRYQVPFVESLAWLDLGWTQVSRAIGEHSNHYANVNSRYLSLSLNQYIYIYIYIYIYERDRGIQYLYIAICLSFELLNLPKIYFVTITAYVFTVQNKWNYDMLCLFILLICLFCLMNYRLYIYMYIYIYIYIYIIVVFFLLIFDVDF